MNRKWMGLRVLMGAAAAIITLLLAACGEESVSGQATMPTSETVSTTSVAPTKTRTPTTPSPRYVEANEPTHDTIESVWAEIAGEEIAPPEFLAGVNVDGPFYGPSPTAGNFDAVTHIGTNCLAVFVQGRAKSNESLVTNLYVERSGLMRNWAARDGIEATVDGANGLIAHFADQCAA